MNIQSIVRDIVEAACGWLDVMDHFRKLVDAKADPQVIEKARVQLVAAAKKLEVATRVFVRVRNKFTEKKPGESSKKLPWGKILRGALQGAGALNDALNKVERPAAAVAVEGEVVTPPSPKAV